MRFLVRGHFFLCFTLSLAACKEEGNIAVKTPEVAIQFNSPEKLSYKNTSEYTAQWSYTNSQGVSTKLSGFEGQVTVELFAQPNCQGSSVFLKVLKPNQESLTFENLQNNTSYSYSVSLSDGFSEFLRSCSPIIMTDYDAPQVPSFTYPSSDHYIGLANFTSRITPVLDNGVSGLNEKPFVLTLYKGINCAGQVVSQLETDEYEIPHSSLVNGAFYSLSVSVRDKAGNFSAPLCSHAVEVDLYVPDIDLVDPTSRTGFSRVNNPNVVTLNDSLAQYWCLTENVSFVPGSGIMDPCPGGQGDTNGWHSSKPTVYNLSAGAGSKTVHIWVADSGGDLLSQRHGTENIVYDFTAPGTFSIVGVGGNNDANFDDWLHSVDQPTVRWNPSSDSYEYIVEIFDSGSNSICSSPNVPASSTQYAFTDCSLTDGETYSVRVISYDEAGNPTVADSDISFVVDLTFPTAFSISGISGGTDSIVDTWLGVADPLVSYTNADGEFQYRISVLDASDNLICQAEVENMNVLQHNYNSSPPATCSAFNHGAQYKALVSAQDEAGNTTPAANSPFVFSVDKVNPSVSITAQPPSVSTSTTASFSFTQSDADSGISSVECQLNAGIFTSCSTSEIYNSLPDGNHIFTVRATDVAGNSNTDSYSWIVDLNTPNLTISSQPGALTNSAFSSFSFSAADTSGIGGYECNLNGGGFSSCTSPHGVTLVEGVHSMAIRATDNAGRSSTETVNWEIDLTSPVINVTSAPSGIRYDELSETIDFNVTEAHPGTVRCRLNAGGWSDCSSGSYNVSGLTAGTQTVDIEATDAAGNVATETVSWTLHTHFWQAGAWGACSASPTWTAWGSCSASPYWGGWGSCSASCGGGVQYRTCYGTSGSQTRSCTNTSGTQTRVVECKRDTGSGTSTVADGNCSGTKPAVSQACTESCSGSATQACTESCSGSSSQSCNTHACCGGTQYAGYCWYVSGVGSSCDAACTSRGGVNLAGTRNYAGSGGNSSQCNAVMVALGFPSNPYDSGTCSGGYGCMRISGNPSATNVRCYNVTTTGSAAAGGFFRACACNN